MPWSTCSTRSVTPGAQPDDLLGASYQLYRHISTNDIILRTITGSYALPAALHAHVETFVPTTYFTAPRKLQQTPSRREAAAMTNATSGEPMTVLSRRDSTDSVVPAFNTLGVVGNLNQYPSPEDLTTLMSMCRIEVEDAKFIVAEVNGGGYDSSHPHPEASVNIQYVGVMAYPIKHTSYSVGGIQEWWVDSKQPTSRDLYLAWFN
ncbi:hypothetical protein H4582DRAFT_2068904 [Lactarius indigo]|nr:hypothetical protein H4582DRAFT_2068904 [Lactarius indigo]